MFKVGMLNLLTTAALLTVASVLDAAPLTPGDPDAFGEPADGDPQRNIERNAAQATRIFEKLLKTRSMTTFPDGDGKTVVMKALDEIVTATSTLDTSDNNPLKTLTLHSDGHEEIGDRSLISSHETQRRGEKNRRFSLSKLMDSNELGDAPSAAREELGKMLGALEELHQLINSTLSHRITFITRGNSNGRSTGKKNKMTVTDGNLKSTTATTLDSGGISPKASTDQMDPKALKKSLPSAKKTNKRVCFWKYCSQN
ncbi:uncharacterized protein LOC132142971 [Carassius carassius]|uniref:uncharacterized protein LOC132142971 n=1 Tax=Carassius carassius TaxID=217509 RepID=UPI0028690EB9|nr:uncharacterized protein LOC132142971 [Carassius carassius]